MAELSPTEPRWTAQQTRAQFQAVAELRWRIFRNGFRRKGGKGDVIALAIMVPLFTIVVLLVSIGAGAGAAYLTSAGHPKRIGWILWGLFALSQLASINLGQPGSTFDPTQLIRFPLKLWPYVAIRLFFGVLSPSNLIISLASLAVAVGVTSVRPDLWAYAFAAMLVFAAVNVLWTRMVFAWVDRWLSTRRAREVFTAVIFGVSVLIQWGNVEFNPAYHHEAAATDRARMQAAVRLGTRAQPYLDALPPGLAGAALDDAAHRKFSRFAADALLCSAYGLAFLGVFALRMRTEYRGENLSDQAHGGHAGEDARLVANSRGERPIAAHVRADPAWRSTVTAVFWKDLLYLRRNLGLFYGLVAPLVMVGLFAGRTASRSQTEWVFPAALAYALLGVVPVSYNSFGMDGTGTQFYFVAPVRIRDVLIAKNAVNAGIACVQIAVVALLVKLVARLPGTPMVAAAVLWSIATLLAAMTIGNYRSLNRPKKIDAGRAAQKQASPLSALLSMGILLAAAAVGWCVVRGAESLAAPWISPSVMLALLLIGAAIYWRNLQRMDAYALEHREVLFEELGKKS